MGGMAVYNYQAEVSLGAVGNISEIELLGLEELVLFFWIGADFEVLKLVALALAGWEVSLEIKG